MSSEKFTFFFKAHSPFSQFHPAKFTGPSLFPQTDSPPEHIANKDQKFQHCEQWMMFNKALLFKDFGSAQKILEATTPMNCKALGRKVSNFDQNTWNLHNEKIIHEGNRLKFTQNSELLIKLLETDGTTLVEASPYDKIYGIGLSATDPRARSRSTWKGRNLLGETLTKLREELK